MPRRPQATSRSVVRIGGNKGSQATSIQRAQPVAKTNKHGVAVSLLCVEPAAGKVRTVNVPAKSRMHLHIRDWEEKRPDCIVTAHECDENGKLFWIIYHSYPSVTGRVRLRETNFNNLLE